MAYDFGNPMMAALLARQQNAMQTSPSLNIGRAISSVQVPQFDNPWATFLASLGTNLLGSGLQSYAYANNANETADLSNQLAEILSSGISANEQKAQLAQNADLGFLANMPNLLEAQRQQEQKDKLADVLLGQGITIDPATGKPQEIPEVANILLNRKIREAAITDSLSSNRTLKDLQDQIDQNVYFKQIKEIAPNMELMFNYANSTDANSDLPFKEAVKQAFNTGALKDDKSIAESLPFIGKIFSSDVLTPEEKARTFRTIFDKVTVLKKFADQDFQSALQQAGERSSRLKLPQLPQFSFETQTKDELSDMQKVASLLNEANKTNKVPKGLKLVKPGSVIPPGAAKFQDTKTGQYYIMEK